MDRLPCELLVHIAAPSSVRDDRRYAAVAQSILNFEPALATRLTLHEYDSPSPLATQVLSDQGEQNVWPNTAAASAAWIQAHDDEFARQQGQANDDESSLPFGRLPSFANSGNGIATCRNTPLAVSDLPRPKTAPETRSSSFDIDVPFTGTCRRRAHSEVSSFSNSFSTVPNSHGPPKDSNALGPGKGAAVSADHGLDSDSYLGESPTTAWRGPQRKKRRLEEFSHISPPVHSQRESLALARPPLTPNKLELARKVDSQTDMGSIASTVSPSQPLKLAALTPVHEMGERTAFQHIPTIDLTTTDHARMDIEDEKRSEPSTDPNQYQTEPHLSDRIKNPQRAQLLGSEIRQLANEVHGPDPVGGEQRFVTHITKTFEILCERVPLTKVFRPIHVERDVGVLERGYWLFWIRIGSEEAVAHSRASQSQREKLGQLRGELEAPTLRLRLKKLDTVRKAQQPRPREPNADGPLWTEAEFVTFWQNMSQFICDGKAGWGIRLTKEASEDRLWKLSMFCWGEVIAHTWLALWILSDKLISRAPMLWISGDGVAVVRMSGGKRGTEGLGPWVKKGEAENRGRWGIGQH